MYESIWVRSVILIFYFVNFLLSNVNSSLIDRD